MTRGSRIALILFGFSPWPALLVWGEHLPAWLAVGILFFGTAMLVAGVLWRSPRCELCRGYGRVRNRECWRCAP